MPGVEVRRVGTSGLRVSALGLGTTGWARDTDADAAGEQLRAFVDAGGTLVDAAANDADGAGEALLGRLLADAGLASEVVVATTAGLGYRSGRVVADLGRRGLLGALDASLDRLGRDHVDLWQLHAWPVDSPLEEALSACEAAVASGRTRYVGVSDFAAWQLALAVAGSRGSRFGATPVSDQVEYSLLERSPEGELAAAAGHLGIGLIGRSALGRGVLTGEYRDGVPADSRAASPSRSGVAARGGEPAARRGEPAARRGEPAARRVVAAVATAADGLGVAPAQVALAWARDRPGVAAVLAGARTAAQWRTALGSVDVTLPAEIRAALDEVSDPAR